MTTVGTTASGAGEPLRIALVTPWPPDHSGIADFSRDLATGLREAGWRVDVFTPNVAAEAVDGVTIVRVPAGWDGRGLESYAFRLYQLGNNIDFHGWMLPALLDHPGVVQLHDIVLHHLLIGLTCAVDDWPSYLRIVRTQYGDEVAKRFEGPLHGPVKPVWETAEVVDYPFFEFFVEHAVAVIVHSRFAARRVAERLPRLPLRQVAQTYRQSHVRQRTTLRRIGIFGGVQDNKKIDWILEAFGNLGTLLDGIQVTVVGAIAEQSEPLVAAAGRLEHLSIDFIGRVDEARFVEELEATDLCISLRHPTMGETSAIVMRALQLGAPTIVSDTGWYAELPVEVAKAPLRDTPNFLSSWIHRLVAEPDAYRAWAAECARLPERLDLSHAFMCNDIGDFLQTFRAERFANDRVTRHMVDLGFVGDPSERPVLDAIAKRSSFSTTDGLRQRMAKR